MNRRVLLLIIGSLLLPLGCEGNNDPTGSSFATLAVTTTSLPNADWNVAYSQALVATGGDNSYAWSVTQGLPPAGISLNTQTGEISGTPTGFQAQRTFRVQVASGDGQTATQQLTIAVNGFLLPSELCSENPNTAIATFVDANLEAAIRAVLAVSAQEPLTCGLISGLMQLDAVDLGIGSLARIQNLTNLTILNINTNSIISISALSGLTSLRSLGLGGNSITDISGLSGLTSLTELDLGGNSITDISGLSGLTSLTNLNLGLNSIRFISPLSGLTSLTYLGLSSNAITDISALSGLTNLTSLLLEHNNSITDISALSGLTSLTFLDLHTNSISDISALSALTSLTVLELSENLFITDINALGGLTSLTNLNLCCNSITNISALGGLTSLTFLNLGANSITSISALSGLTSLTRLELWINSISDITALSGLTSLNVLFLGTNPNLSNIQPLLDNTGLGTGDRVGLNFTSVSCTDVAALQAMGVIVSSDCP